jgi:hypothetical protein
MLKEVKEKEKNKWYFNQSGKTFQESANTSQ